jgi:hypothetical protein
VVVRRLAPADLLLEAGEDSRHEQLVRALADTGYPFPLQDLARSRRQSPQWHRLLTFGLEADGRTADPWNSTTLQAGRTVS